MTLGLPGMDALSTLELRPTDVLWGIDSDTKRVSVAHLQQPALGASLLEWRTLSLPGAASWPLHIRQSRALEELVAWFHLLKGDWGVPTLVTLEQPFSSNSQSAVQDWSFGTLLCALGIELGVGVDVRSMNPGEWKLPATGHGYGPGIRRAGRSKKEARAMEKARLMEWARSVGYTGESQDEADAVGVVVGSAVRLEGRRRG